MKIGLAGAAELYVQTMPLAWQLDITYGRRAVDRDAHRREQGSCVRRRRPTRVTLGKLAQISDPNSGESCASSSSDFLDAELDRAAVGVRLRQFDSKALRCRPAECEKRYRERRFSLAIMA